MEFERLPQDFLFLLDVCKSPEQVFSHDSRELQLTRMWLDYLSTYEAESVLEMRRVNVYMSHLCAALVEGKLYGPFVREPPSEGKLPSVDFHEVLVTDAAEPNIKCQTMLAAADSTIMDDISDSGVVSGQEQIPEFSHCENYRERDINSRNQEQIPHISHRPSNSLRESNSPAIESKGHITVGSTSLYYNVTTGGGSNVRRCQCPPKPCQCQVGNVHDACICNVRPSAGLDRAIPHKMERLQDNSFNNYLMNDLNLPPELCKNFSANLSSFIDLCKGGGGVTGDKSNQPLGDSPLSQITALTKFLPKPSAENLKSNASPENNSEATEDKEELRKDILELLEAISAELRGEMEPGSSRYLERELARYNNFLMSRPNEAEELRTLQSDRKLRFSLLLGLQSTLVKLLSDFTRPK